MNENIIKGTWDQISGEAKKLWGKLTDDEITQTEGHAEKLSGLIQERYGRGKEDAMKEVDEFLSKHGSNTDTIEGKWTQFVGEAKKLWGKLTDDELVQAQGHAEKLSGIIQERYGLSKIDADREVNEFLQKQKVNN